MGDILRECKMAEFLAPLNPLKIFGLCGKMDSFKALDCILGGSSLSHFISF